MQSEKDSLGKLYEIFDRPQSINVSAVLRQQILECAHQFEHVNETTLEKLLRSAAQSDLEDPTIAQIEAAWPNPCILPFVQHHTLLPGENTIGNFMPNKSVTLITQGGIRRIDRLFKQISTWHGPASVALYLTDKNDSEAVVSLVNRLREANLLDLTIISFVYEPPIKKLGYPHNVLRNVAMNHSQTDYYFYVDGDFVFPHNAHDKLMALMEVDSDFEQLLSDRMLFIIPAFEFRPPANNTFGVESVPNMSTDVVRMISDGNAQSFYNDSIPGGHAMTDFSKWMEIAKSNFSAKHNLNSENSTWSFSKPPYYPAKYKRQSEPYFVGLRESAPRFEDAYREWGLDRYTWVYELSCVGNHKFSVLSDFFVFHLSHKRSSTNGFPYWKRNKILHSTFTERMEKVGC